MPSPLRDPLFRRLYAAQVIALAGTGVASVALALLAFDLAGADAGAVLGIALAIKMTAYVTVSPLVGAVAHRLPRRATLVTLDIARAALVACLPFVSATWQIYLLIGLVSLCAAAFTPLFQATIPDILPDEERYLRALSLSRIAYDLEALLSPTLAALLLAVTGFSALFAANALAFGLSALLVLSVTLPAPVPVERLAGTRLFGLRAYLATPRLRGLALLSLAAAAGGAMVIVNSVVYVRGTLAGSDADLAWALAAAGAGSMLAALVLPRVLARHSPRPVMLAGGLLVALALTLGIVAPGYAGLLVLWLGIGIGTSLIQTPAGQVVRASCHAPDRLALFAAQFTVSHAGWFAAYALAGWLGAAVSLDAAFVALAALALVSTLGAARLWPRALPDVLEHSHAPTEHAHLHYHDEHHRHEHEGWEGPEPHAHPHAHGALRHRHVFVIDGHHPRWPA